jgi:hypothetical protein
MKSGYFNRVDAELRALGSRWLFSFRSRKQIDINYHSYCISCSINERINNRSWLNDSITGAMVLSYTYKRRDLDKEKPKDYRPRFGISWYENFPF